MTENLLADDELFMRRALALASIGEALGEVPVGAVLVCDGEIIGEGFNQPISSNDPSAHAEIVAIRQAAQTKKNYRLINSTLYVTLEPCTMCVGALIHARVERLVFGTREPKAGVVESRAQLLGNDFLNHKVRVTSGICGEDCQHQLSTFFKRRRMEQKQDD